MEIFVVNIVDFDGGQIGNTFSQLFRRTLKGAEEVVDRKLQLREHDPDDHANYRWSTIDGKQGRREKNPGEDVYCLPRDRLVSDIWYNWDFGHPRLLYITKEELPE